MSNNTSSGPGATPRQIARQIRQQSQSQGRSAGRTGSSSSQLSSRRAAPYQGPIQPGMGSSRYANVPNSVAVAFEPDLMELDPMEIDTQAEEPPAATTMTRMAEGSSDNRIYRHILYIHIQSHPMPTVDLDVLTAARAELTRLQSAGMPIMEAMSERHAPHVYIRIDTYHANRDHAITDAYLRMGTMQGMIQDGLGWFGGLPYRHPNFEVKFLRGRRL